MSNAAIEIHMSDQVRQLLGPNLVGKVAAATLADGRCQYCRQRLPTSDVVNVVVFQDQDSCVVGYLHPHCGTSQIRPLPARTLATTGPATVPMQLFALLQHDGSRRLPVLAIHPMVQALTVDGHTQPEPADAFIAALVQTGMTTEVSLMRVPEPLLDWPIAITAAGPDAAAIQIRMPNGALLCDGVTAMPQGWRNVVSRLGWCVLYAGHRLPSADEVRAPDARWQAGAVCETVGARLRIFGAARSVG